jgi:hypothetical protein
MRAGGSPHFLVKQCGLVRDRRYTFFIAGLHALAADLRRTRRRHSPSARIPCAPWALAPALLGTIVTVRGA